ncbi:MAG: hypothetical protein LBH20_05595 [Treponema sp.]|jgi:hypothetical protein|nr:hypothetical protein [Treponema sp.]
MDSSKQGKTMMDSRFFFAAFLTIFWAFTAAETVYAQAQENRFYIDLQKFPLYIKADFNPSDAISPDLQDGSWQVMEQWPGAVIRRIVGGGG